jgi:hypothetical protein
MHSKVFLLFIEELVKKDINLSFSITPRYWTGDEDNKN